MTLTDEFILLHSRDDVTSLALRGGSFPGVDMPRALRQIEGRQKARVKIPSWAAADGIVYPPRRAVEQASSEETALYKRRIVSSLLSRFAARGGESMTDLTGGLGVDCAFLSPLFREAVYVERNRELCDIAERNFRTLNLGNITTVCSGAEEYLHLMKPCFLAYLDPDRRDAGGKRKYALEDCSPDVTKLCRELLEKADFVLVKCSPMLDWHKAVADLRAVREVHIISVRGECRELLVLMGRDFPENGGPKVVCADSGQVFSFFAGSAEKISSSIAAPLEDDTKGFLCVPGPSLMKAGCFPLLCEKYGMKMIADNSHLFISPDKTGDFQGKCYKILAVAQMNKPRLKACLKDMKKANVAVRNFPMSADGLRRRLGLGDGGNVFIFGTTDSARRHVLVIAESAATD